MGTFWSSMWDRISAERETALVPQWHTISAKTGEGTEELLDHLFAALPEGPLLFPEEVLSDFPRRWAVADTIREKLFGFLTDELPHSVGVNVTELDETDDGWMVQATILVERATQRPIGGG